MANQTELKTSITKQIVFPKKLINVAQIKMNKLGIGLPEYVRYLIIRDTEDLLKELPILDQATEKEVAKGIEDYKNGKYTTLNSPAQIEKYFKKVLNE